MLVICIFTFVGFKLSFSVFCKTLSKCISIDGGFPPSIKIVFVKKVSAISSKSVKCISVDSSLSIVSGKKAFAISSYPSLLIKALISLSLDSSLFLLLLPFFFKIESHPIFL